MSITARPDSILASALKSAVGEGVTATGEHHVVDGIAPSFVVSPSSVEDMAAVMELTSQQQVAVIPWGAGSQMALGNVPAAYDIALSTTHLSRIIEYEPADLTITVEAGVTLGQIREQLGERGQFLPLDGPDESTIGGRLAVGHGGPSQHAHGLPRDWVLGCKIALPDGTVTRVGGRVVKNVAGYDLTRLAVGSLGTLGVIVEATLKVAPVPPAQETLLAAHIDTATAISTTHAVVRRGLALRAIAVIENQAAYWLSGPAAAVVRTRDEVAAITDGVDARTLTGNTADRWWASLDRLDATADIVVRIMVPPSSLVTAMQTLADAGNDAGVAVQRIAYPAVGVVMGRLSHGEPQAYARMVEQVRREAVTHGGSLVVTKAPVDVKNRIDVWGESPALPLMRSLKQEFDPEETLNPGRFVGGL